MSRATVRIPTPLRNLTGGADEVLVEGDSVGELLADLGRYHAGVCSRILDEHGHVRPFVNVFLGGKNVRSIGGLTAPIADGDVLTILPAVAGGAPAPRPRGRH